MFSRAFGSIDRVLCGEAITKKLVEPLELLSSTIVPRFSDAC